jgi:Xaa-Pro dipeptidase
MARIVSESSALTDAPTATRLDDLRAWMARQNLDAAYITRPVSIAYLTGVRAEPFERLMALAVKGDHATLILPAIERENAERAMSDADIISWRDGEDPYRLVHEALRGSIRLGVEKEHLTLAAAEALRELVGPQEMLDAGPELKRLRRTKSPVELEKLAHAAAITDAATMEILGRLRGGQSELEVAVALGAAIGSAGGTLAFETIVLSGPNSALPHGHPSGGKLEAGDIVLLDFGAAYEGYRADTTRVAVVGEPDERQREIHRTVLAAHDAAIAAVKAGTTTGAVDAAARKVIEAAGLGDRFFHRTGHGLGLETHEDPSLDPGSKMVLEVGMVFTIEPGVYIPGWGGVRIEDDVVVEAGGCRLLTEADRSLLSVPNS